MAEVLSDPLVTLPAGTHEAFVGAFEAIDKLGPGLLRDYMDTPATIMADRGDGYQYPAQADYSNGDEVKRDIQFAAGEVAAGRIGVARLISGSVSGNHDANTGDGPNLRSAFEHIDDVFRDTPLVAPTGFHQMFQAFDPRAAEAQIGYPSERTESGSELEGQIVAAAQAVLRNGRTIPVNDADGRPDGILMPLQDPATGMLLPNAFLKVHSDIFSDRDGTRSLSAHLAFASLIVLPEGLLEAHDAKEKIGSGPAVPDTEAILHISHGLPSRNKIGGERIGGTFSDSLMRSALVERPTADGGTEGLTHLMIAGGAVLGIVRTLDADHKLQDSRLVLLPVGSQAAEATNSGHVRGHTLLSLDAETAKRPRHETHGARQGFESITLGHKEITSVYGLEDKFVSGRHAEVRLSHDHESVNVQDLKSLNGIGVLTIDTLMRKGEGALEGMALESTLALLETLKEQPQLWNSLG